MSLITVTLKCSFKELVKQESDEKSRGVEGRKLEEAEMKISEISETSEARICILEEKILELSEMLGNAEKSKLNDQSTIQKLKERTVQVAEAIFRMKNDLLFVYNNEIVPFLVGSGEQDIICTDREEQCFG